jgi:hypothetical protein
MLGKNPARLRHLTDILSELCPENAYCAARNVHERAKQEQAVSVAVKAVAHHRKTPNRGSRFQSKDSQLFDANLDDLGSNG